MSKYHSANEIAFKFELLYMYHKIIYNTNYSLKLIM